MHSRWYNVAVIGLWLSAMGWLVVEKVMPPLRVGHPPSYAAILRAERRRPLVGWQMISNGRPLGWALSKMSRLEDDTTEINSQVHFDELPIESFAPEWLRAYIGPSVARLRMDADSTTIIDPLARLSSFRSTLRLYPTEIAIKLQGNVVGNRLKLVAGFGGLTRSSEVYLPANSLLGGALSPRTELPDLQLGQTWTVPVYSPLRPPNDPLEILQATVESSESIVWDDRREEIWLVVYRSDGGRGLGEDEPYRGRLWVRRDGTVLKQQVMLLSSTMTFTRLTEQQTVSLAARVRNTPR